MYQPTLFLAAIASLPLFNNPVVAPVDAMGFPMPTHEVLIRGGAGEGSSSMIDLLHSYEEATGQNFVVSADSRNYLEASSTGLLSDVTVQPERLQEVFEALLAANDFVLTVLTDEAPRLLSVVSLQTSHRHTVSSAARFILHEQVPDVDGHPAMLFKTTVNLPGVDSRQLTTAMRQMIADPTVALMLPAGSSDQVIVMASGNKLNSMVELLQKVAENDAANWSHGMAEEVQSLEAEQAKDD